MILYEWNEDHTHKYDQYLIDFDYFTIWIQYDGEIGGYAQKTSLAEPHRWRVYELI